MLCTPIQSILAMDWVEVVRWFHAAVKFEDQRDEARAWRRGF